jgi:hypothetical protein
MRKRFAVLSHCVISLRGAIPGGPGSPNGSTGQQHLKDA